MAQKKNKFQIISLVFFGVFIVIGFAGLAIYGQLQRDASGTVRERVNITIWGTLPSASLNNLINTLNQNIIVDDTVSFKDIRYVQKNEINIRSEFIEAVALNSAPDVVLLPHEIILDNEALFVNIPYSRYPRSSYESTFVRSSNVFLRNDGFLSVPFLVDPLVLYANENLRVKNKLTRVPSNWNELLTGEFLSVVNRDGTRIDEALIPFGVSRNYSNTKNVVTALLLQVFDNPSADKEEVASTLQFFAGFSDASRKGYTWNSVLPEAKDFFLANKLFLYPGLASEYNTLRRSNPNLAISVHPIPQLENSVSNYARVYGFAITKGAPSQNQSLDAVFSMIGILGTNLDRAQDILPIPPALKGYAVSDSATREQKVIADSVITAKSPLFSNLVEYETFILRALSDISLGVVSPDEAVKFITDDILNALR